MIIIALTLLVILLTSVLIFTVVLGKKKNNALTETKNDVEHKVEGLTQELKGKSEELKNQSAALDSAANGIVITDTDGIVTYIKPIALDLSNNGSIALMHI